MQPTTSTRSAPTAHRRRSPRRTLALHAGEMLIAMMAGMLVLGGALEGTLVLAGTSVADGSAAVEAAVMAVTMTAGMVWWMTRRGHPRARNAEMAASMIVPTIAVVALHWAGGLGSDAVLAVQHVVMIPAMVGVMAWRHEHYAHC